MVLPRQKDFSCFDCKFYAPNPAIEFQGHCAKNAPTGENGVFYSGPATTGAEIVQPSITWCGDFAKWTGEPREEGTCPYTPPSAEAMEIETLNVEDIENIVKTATLATETANVAAKSATDATKKAEVATAEAENVVAAVEVVTEEAKTATTEAKTATTAAKTATTAAKKATTAAKKK